MSDCSGVTAMVEERTEQVDHPQHYGGKDNQYEAIKVIEAWGLGFCLGNTVKYISRAGKKEQSKTVEDLKKALWYLQRYCASGDTSVTRDVPSEYQPRPVALAWGLCENLEAAISNIFYGIEFNGAQRDRLLASAVRFLVCSIKTVEGTNATC